MIEVKTLRDKVTNVDKRQDSFETFVRANIEYTKERMKQIDERMNKMEAQMTERMEQLHQENRETSRHIQNLFYANIGAWAIGVIAVVIAICVTR